MLKITVSAGVLLFSASAFAAGFDCSLSTLNQTEQTICGDSYLSGIDNKLNTLFATAQANSFGHGSLYRQQRQWVKERNKCGTDAECIKKAYLSRNDALIAVSPFIAFDKAFSRRVDSPDPPMSTSLRNKNGFTLSDDPWRVKRLLSTDYDLLYLNKLSYREWHILTHRIIHGDLTLFLTVKGLSNNGWISYIFQVSEFSPPLMVASYSEDDDVLTIRYEPSKDGRVRYSLFQAEKGTTREIIDYVRTIYSLDTENDRVDEISREIVSPEAIKPEPWIGYCDSQRCKSRVTSPDGKWRLASADGYKNDDDEGVYYFPADRPDLGVNVFLPQADTAVTKDYEYERSYVWGDENTFYFDNYGGYACIWKTDIVNKTTRRILPAEGIVQPYYVSYDHEDLIITTYRYYDELQKKQVDEIYVAKK